MLNTNATKTLLKLCYCQSARHSRAAVRALEHAGYAARTDITGYIYCYPVTESAQMIVDEAIKCLK